MDLLLIFLLYGGGVLSALALLIYATIHRERLRRVLLLSGLSLGCLFAQRSCWRVADEIGRATGGGSGGFNIVLTIAFIVCIIWILVLILTSSNRA